ncbi:hypothetical protein SDC9_143298 [bioreactor metagenome]|uniref:Uncharacterized protein n=1 Tax=bioreactor metagenome TaxID=1076179 RepID=A0A645E3K3_9ZZZZ
MDSTRDDVNLTSTGHIMAYLISEKYVAQGRLPFRVNNLG